MNCPKCSAPDNYIVSYLRNIDKKLVKFWWCKACSFEFLAKKKTTWNPLTPKIIGDISAKVVKRIGRCIIVEDNKSSAEPKKVCPICGSTEINHIKLITGIFDAAKKAGKKLSDAFGKVSFKKGGIVK